QVDEREHVDAHAELLPDRGREHEPADDERERRPEEVGDEQHLATAPPVEEHPGPRPHDRERREEHREGDRDLARARRALGREEEERREPCLEHAVGGLAHDPDREEASEVADPQKCPELGKNALRITVSLTCANGRAPAPYGAGALPSVLVAEGGQRSISPARNASRRARPTQSCICSGGDFMQYVDAAWIGPPTPRSLAIFAARSASM